MEFFLLFFFLLYVFNLCVCVHACHNQECGTYEIWHRCLKNLNRRVLLKKGIYSQGFLVVFLWWFLFFLLPPPPRPIHFPYFFPPVVEIEKVILTNKKMLTSSQSSYDVPSALSAQPSLRWIVLWLKFLINASTEILLRYFCTCYLSQYCFSAVLNYYNWNLEVLVLAVGLWFDAI